LQLKQHRHADVDADEYGRDDTDSNRDARARQRARCDLGRRLLTSAVELGRGDLLVHARPR
jgi:hypothetical protein